MNRKGGREGGREGRELVQKLYAPNILIGVCLILFTMAVGFLAGLRRPGGGGGRKGGIIVGASVMNTECHMIILVCPVF